MTTCSKAGSTFGLQLLWALTFSTLATIILQEAAARITIASGKNLGEILALKYRRAGWLKALLFGMVAFGCAAYQAGNILGAVSGLLLVFDVSQQLLVLLLGMLAAALLWAGTIRIIATVLAAVVFCMGLAFLVVAVQSSVSLTDAVGHALLPAFPENAALLVIGLVGTTVVPYNLFLASGISRGQDVREMRFGISLAVLIGGVISMAILLAGTQIAGEFSFQALAAALRTGLGEGAGVLFAFGLFAAGASSAVTAPLAAAITGQSLLGGDDKRWSVKSVRFRLVWAMVLGVGLGFGLSEVKPIPAIIAAQAINGVLLPVVAVFLWLAVNDRRLLPERFVNKGGLNVAMGAVVAVAAALGLYNLWKSLVSLTG